MTISAGLLISWRKRLLEAEAHQLLAGPIGKPLHRVGDARRADAGIAAGGDQPVDDLAVDAVGQRIGGDAGGNRVAVVEELQRQLQADRGRPAAAGFADGRRGRASPAAGGAVRAGRTRRRPPRPGRRRRRPPHRSTRRSRSAGRACGRASAAAPESPRRSRPVPSWPPASPARQTREGPSRAAMPAATSADTEVAKARGKARRRIWLFMRSFSIPNAGHEDRTSPHMRSRSAVGGQ